MRRFLLTALAVSGGLLAAEQPVLGLRVAVPANLQTSQKVAQADVIVTGKVTSVEKETVELPQFAGDKNKAAFTVAVIKVESALSGVKNVTHLKVAFIAQPGAGGGEVPGEIIKGPGIRPFPGRGFGPVQLTEGQEGIFFLQKHPGSDSYYSVQQGMTPVSAKVENYKAELVKVKGITEAIADPVKALKAEKLDARLTAVAAIVGKYRQPARNGQSVEVAIPAEETKLIMKTLLEADWTVADMPAPGFDYQSAPANIASMIGLYPGGNGIPPIIQKPGESYNAKYKEAVKAWYEKSGEKFEIKKFVAKDKK
jgi:hypothetical protein